MAAAPRTDAVNPRPGRHGSGEPWCGRSGTSLQRNKQTTPVGFLPAPGVWARPVRHLFATSLFALFLTACPGPVTPDCRVGADCASGVCRGDGTCAPIATVDAGHDAGTTSDDAGAQGTDAGHDAGAMSDAGFDAGMPIGCQPNHDGTIERSEVFFQAGLRATFKISGAATFDTAGTAAADGGRRWDFTPALTGDTSRLVETKPLQGEWYESTFPDAGYVTELGSGGLLGVFGTTADGLYLQGVVSPAMGSSQTKVTYDPWVKVLQFPLVAGASWTTETTVSGEYEGKIIGTFATVGVFGLPFQKETYTSSVDRSGDAVTPFSTFPSLRVRTVMERYTRIYTLNPWTKFLTLRTFSWNAECFGTVATVSSTDDETATEFTSAAEVRRLSP